MENPLVSIIIPACDRVEQLKNTLNSIFSQDMDDYEIIVCENNSKNKKYFFDSLKQYTDQRLKVFSLEKCNNANVARNYGVTQATGEYIAFMDSDDLWEEMHLSKNLVVIQNNDVEFIYGGAKIFDGLNYRNVPSRDIRVNESPVDYMLGWCRGYAQTSSYFLRASSFEKVKWDEGLSRNQDVDFFIRAADVLRTKYSGFVTTTIIWEKGVKRSFCLDSMLNFFKGNVGSMKNSTKVRYLLIVLKSVISHQQPFKIFPFVSCFLKSLYK